MYVVSTAPALAFDYILIIVIWPAMTLKNFRVVICIVVDISNILESLDLLNPLYLLDPLELILPVGSISPNGSFGLLGLLYLLGFSGVFEYFLSLDIFVICNHLNL